jgi:hypothetical protein
MIDLFDYLEVASATSQVRCLQLCQSLVFKFYLKWVIAYRFRPWVYSSILVSNARFCLFFHCSLLIQPGLRLIF